MRADFNLQFNSALAPSDALSLIERDFGSRIREHRGFKALPRTATQLAYARRKWGSEFAGSAASSLLAGALEPLGTVAEFGGGYLEVSALMRNTSERIIFTVTAQPTGSTVNVAGRADLGSRQLVDQVVATLNSERPARRVCARCRGPVDGSLWCSGCAAELDACKIDPAEPSQIMDTARVYKEMCESGSTARFVDVFAFDVFAEYPDEGRTVSRAQLEAGLETALAAMSGCEMVLEAAFGDRDRYWLAWHLKHPKAVRPRFVECVRLNGDGRVSEVSVHSV